MEGVHRDKQKSSPTAHFVTENKVESYTYNKTEWGVASLFITTGKQTKVQLIFFRDYTADDNVLQQNWTFRNDWTTILQ